MIEAKAPHIIRPLVFQNGIFYMLALLIALGLKYHYSRAGGDDLTWILKPTARLVESICGIQFESEAHTGYVSREYRIIIAPSCAGINFLIMVFCMAVFSGIHSIRHFWLKLVWSAASLVSAYGFTVAVNSLRIIASIYSYNTYFYFGWFTPARIHRLQGIVIYFFFLCLFYMIIIKTVRRVRRAAGGQIIPAVSDRYSQTNYFRWARTGLIPLLWYGLITLGVPLLRGAFQADADRFKEHCFTVIGASLAVLAIIFLIQGIHRRIERIEVFYNFCRKEDIPRK